MGSTASPIIANLYMEYFEQTALSTVPTPRLWCWYVDDTFVIQKEENKQNFLQHINSVDPAIQFTVENNKEDLIMKRIIIIIPKHLYQGKEVGDVLCRCICADVWDRCADVPN